MRGSLTLNGKTLSAGDAAAVEDEPDLYITATAAAEALLFDLA
jgi:redox-sensitive bicupin YhaK (pirin superfamily)